MGTVKEGWVGRFFEDFEVGDIYRCRLGRTITETDNIHFTLLTNNTNQIHFNAHYASRTEFKRPLVNSAMTLSVVAGLGVADISENGFALGWDYIKLPNPVFAGDTLYCSAKSGFIPGPKSGIYAATVEHQLRQTMRNLLDGLEEAGMDFSNVVATNVYLDNLSDFAAMNHVYTQYFVDGVMPARTTVQQAPPGERKADAEGRWPTLEQISIVAVK